MAALLPSVTAIRKRPFLHLKRPSAQEAMLPTVNIICTSPKAVLNIDLQNKEGVAQKLGLPCPF